MPDERPVPTPHRATTWALLALSAALFVGTGVAGITVVGPQDVTIETAPTAEPAPTSTSNPTPTPAASQLQPESDPESEPVVDGKGGPPTGAKNPSAGAPLPSPPITPVPDPGASDYDLPLFDGGDIFFEPVHCPEDGVGYPTVTITAWFIDASPIVSVTVKLTGADNRTIAMQPAGGPTGWATVYHVPSLANGNLYSAYRAEDAKGNVTFVENRANTIVIHCDALVPTGG